MKAADGKEKQIKMKISIKETAKSKNAPFIPFTGSWSDFLNLIQSPEISRDFTAQRLAQLKPDLSGPSKTRKEKARNTINRAKDGRCLLGGEVFALNGSHDKNNVQNHWLLNFDVDGSGIPYEQMKAKVSESIQGNYCLYTTFKSEKCDPKYRILVPLEAPISDEIEFKYITKAFFRKYLSFVNELDKCSFIWNQLMYLPRIPSGGGSNYFFQSRENSYPVSRSEMKDLLEEQKIIEKEQSAAFQRVLGNPRINLPKGGELFSTSLDGLDEISQKKGVIREFNLKYTIPEALEIFQVKAYEPTNVPYRYTYADGSSLGGLVLVSPYKAFSHHQSDPLGKSPDGELKPIFAYDIVLQYGKLWDSMGNYYPIRTTSNPETDRLRFHRFLRDNDLVMVQDEPEADYSGADRTQKHETQMFSSFRMNSSFENDVFEIDDWDDSGYQDSAAPENDFFENRRYQGSELPFVRELDELENSSAQEMEYSFAQEKQKKALIMDERAGRQNINDSLQLDNLTESTQVNQMYRDQDNKAEITDVFEAMISRSSKDLIPTGFDTLDETLGGGLWPGLNVLFADPKMGKSWGSMQIIFNAIQDAIATGKDLKVILASLELTKSKVLARFISMISLELFGLEGFISASAAETDYQSMSIAEKKRFEACKDYFLEKIHPHLVIVAIGSDNKGTGVRNPSQVWALCNLVSKLKQQGTKQVFLVIDYLQRLSRNGLEERQGIMENLRILSEMYTAYRVPVLAVAIKSKAGTHTTTSDIEQLRYIKGAGEIEYDAQTAILLKNGSYSLVLNRDGATFMDKNSQPIVFDELTCQFSEMDYQDEPEPDEPDQMDDVEIWKPLKKGISKDEKRAIALFKKEFGNDPED